ncbi:ABC transporter permease [bacterium]|nr:ABC transporter permease [bacterium]
MQESVYKEAASELGSKDVYIERQIVKDHAEQERNIARWWFRAEEEFVEFGALRQLGRAFTQTQFGKWFRSLALGLDLGESFVYKGKTVKELILKRLPVTLWLNFFSIVLTYLIAVPLGVFSATHPKTVADRVTTVSLFILYSLPSFWVGAILILLVTGPPPWFPSHGIDSIDSWKLGPWDRFVDWMRHMVLPVACLTYGGIAYISRQMRAGMLETIRQDYVRTARAKGLPEKVVIFKHAMRNSLIPIVTILAYLLPSMFGGSVIIESIFSIDGLGRLMFEAILARDYPVIMAEVFISGLLTLAGILLADVTYAIVDPRIELK